jgi:hypothetical protein
VRLRIGYASLLLANLVHWFVHPAGEGWQNLADGTFGALLAIAAGFLLLGMRSRPRPCLPSGD